MLRRRRFSAGNGLLAALASIGLAISATAAESRPSILLVVVDTLRSDAVSAYGAVEGTTPTIDRLGAEGLLYRRAYSPSSWTLPSHATLLSGLGPDEHRTGMPGRAVLPESVVTLAERLAAAGYETAAISENILVSDVFALLQGFEYRRSSRYDEKRGEIAIDAVSEAREWFAQRDPKRPFFLFVNLIDAHVPYTIRKENPFVPDGTSAGAVRSRAENPHRLLCGGLPGKDEIEVLRGLYLGDVAAADAKLRDLVALARGGEGNADTIAVVTSDHGEFFGERKMLGHEFGLGEAVLHIPLVVNGLDPANPQVIDDPVALVDLAPSILKWAGLPVPEELRGRPLPESPNPSDAGKRSLFAGYTDSYLPTPNSWDGLVVPESKEGYRQFCSPSDPVYGHMATLTRYPLKLFWFERYPPELYDLSWDPGEALNQAERDPEVVERMTKEIESFVRATRLDASESVPDAEVSEDVIDALRGLGYVR